MNNLAYIDLTNNFISDISSLCNVTYQGKVEIGYMTYDSRITLDDNFLNLNENNNLVINQLKERNIDEYNNYFR